jgi:endonuclease/exonuclease/phosphatase family metal-dependent hydrolase
MWATKRAVSGRFMLLLSVCAVAGFPRAGAATRNAALLETGSPARVRQDRAPHSVKIVTYNIRYAGGETLAELGDLLAGDPELGGAQLIGLQEVDRAKKRTGYVNTARVLAERLGMYYAWAGQPWRGDEQEEDTGVALLSAFPLCDVERVELPHVGPHGRRRVALGATAVIGDAAIRVYVVHAERRIGTQEHLDQYRAVVDALAAHRDPGPAVGLGDLNSHRFVRETEDFFSSAGFSSAVASSEPTFEVVIATYRLDWILLRGLVAGRGGVVRHARLSDHWPMWTTVSLAP